MDDRDPMEVRGLARVSARRCTAKARSGKRCRRAPIPGGRVCHMHGGAAPQVASSARERLALMGDPALGSLMRALRCRDMGAAVRAARDVLDRNGMKVDTLPR